uniref:Uncharacterized protein n=1 Tax=Anguilla anguilla TaxID=7936 RepID=A0A0E9USV5_ANGAN
MGDGVAGLVRL